jgi:hypothetical protein
LHPGNTKNTQNTKKEDFQERMDDDEEDTYQGKPSLKHKKPGMDTETFLFL